MKRGFTLIEVMVSSVIMVVLAASVLGLQYILSNSQLSAFNSYTAVEEANSIISAITFELRSLQPADTGAYPLEVAGDNEIVFYSDVDYDGDVERVRYSLAGTQMLKGVVEPSGNPTTYDLGTERVILLSAHMDNTITNPVFLYFNGDWPADTANNPLLGGSRISDTRLVRVTLNLRVESDIDADTFSLETHIAPRALKTNL